MFTTQAAEVLITVPGDSGRFRSAVEHALSDWNVAHAQPRQFVLVPAAGKQRAGDEFGHASDLNEVRADGDLVIAMCDPMRRNLLKTIEDVIRATRTGKLTLVWLLTPSPSDGLSSADQARLHDATQQLIHAGIAPRYIGRGDFDLERRLLSALTADLAGMNLGSPPLRLDRVPESSAVASYRQAVTTYRTPVTLLGPQTWAVTAINHGHSLVVGLTVSVDAVDYDGNTVPDGAQRSRQPIADVLAKLSTAPWPDQLRHLSDGPGVASQAPKVAFLTQRTDLLAAHTARDFPRWLRPNQHASSLYTVEPQARLRVRVQYEDDAGAMWSRTNDAKPQAVSAPGQGDRHRIAYL